jgi:AcrR family transcriptional regulator
LDSAREKIVQAGREMLLEGRLGSVTTNTIAERCRISKKTLYKVFSSKEELLEAIVLSFVEETLAQWDAILSRKAPAIDRILASLEFAGETIPRMQTLVVSQVEKVAPAFWDRIDAVRMERVRRLVGLVAQAQGEGHIRRDIDPDLWALLLLETVRHVLTPKTIHETGHTLPELVRMVRLVYFDALLTLEGRTDRAQVRKESR